ncbi:MAG TPA: class I SAM-dependent methyltransferase [Pyrinomonadaceae bacterium]|jgi:ubiquinone/menaquinone biosynthesis C-methylase UbiE|nr:class I SAM-dependent methyltransferase [Pyrinomonadaceae bacterium]
MGQSELTITKHVAEAGSFYDRIAGLYDMTFKLNGYGRSLDQYLRAHPLPLSPGARILDAGCGTGLLTLALVKAATVPVRITAVDLSASSLAKAARAVAESARRLHQVRFTQGNLLALPFADETFEVIVTSGALEYVPLREGFNELARVLVPGGHILHLPVRPSIASRFLELLFRFKTHPPLEVAESTERHFRIVEHYRFPPLEPIGWTKTAVLAQKV